MNRQEFKQRLLDAPILLDGAMGTELHRQGITFEQSFDAINLSDPALVATIHRSYIEAGADLIETNTFGGNRFRLAEHNLQGQVRQINETAVAIARRVIAGSFKEVLLAGAVGPLGVRLAPLGRVTRAEAQAAFHEQIEALVTAEAGGVDLLFVETMSDLVEIRAAVAAAREVAPDMPVVVQMTFTRDDRTLLGDTTRHIAEELAKLDIDAIGVNCSSGPAQVLRLIDQLHRFAPQLPISAAPNAGWPEQQDGGRVLYPATPGYFGEYTRSFVAAGANLVGGCCGTTAAHIAEMRHSLDTPGEITRPLPPRIQFDSRKKGQQAEAEEPTQLARYFATGQFVVTVELNPPKGVATQRLLEGARTLKEAGANLINIADSPLARMRMSGWAAAYLLQEQIGLETVLHFPTRGRNLLRIQGDLLAAHALGIRNLFVTMGDPTVIGDFPEAMDSYDIVPTGLIRLIKEQFNSGFDKAGRTIDQPTSFVAGCALNLTPGNPDREMKLLRKKIEHGADFALTQPVFDPEQAIGFLADYEERYGRLTLPIVAGVKPLYNSRNAEFLHNEVPGILIDAEHRRRMREAQNPQQEGVDIAQGIVQRLRSHVQGIYLMPAFGRYDLAADVLDVLREPALAMGD